MSETIDAEFAVMAQDECYRELNLQMAEEFAQSDWEAWQMADPGRGQDPVAQTLGHFNHGYYGPDR